jgi:multiple sugar transport system substrate-binding protein
MVLDSPEVMKGLEMYKKLYNAGISPTRAQAASQGDGEMFKSGKVAMFYGGAGDRFETEPGTFKVGMVLPPKGDVQVTFSGIYGTAVSKTTKYPEIAVQALVDFNKLTVEWKGVSPTKSGYDTFNTAHPDKAYGLETIKKAAAIARGFNLIPEEIEMEGVMNAKLTMKIEKGEDIKASVDATIAKWATIIKK